MATMRQLMMERWKERDRRFKEVVINGAKDWAEYRYMLGYLRGMYDLVHEDLDPVLQKMEALELEGEVDE